MQYQTWWRWFGLSLNSEFCRRRKVWGPWLPVGAPESGGGRCDWGVCSWWGSSRGVLSKVMLDTRCRMQVRVDTLSSSQLACSQEQQQIRGWRIKKRKEHEKKEGEVQEEERKFMWRFEYKSGDLLRFALQMCRHSRLHMARGSDCHWIPGFT